MRKINAGLTVVQALGSLVAHHANCVRYCNEEWREKCAEEVKFIEQNFLPSGSGVDQGATVDLEVSDESRLVIQTSFHHMNETGYYDGWTEHEIIVTPRLSGSYDMRITGKDRNGIKEYLTELFGTALDQEYADA